MINPITVMKMLNERHQFIQNHPDFYPFLKENFGEGIRAGDIDRSNRKASGRGAGTESDDGSAGDRTGIF